MITGVRTCLVCASIDQTEDNKISYIDINDDRLFAPTQPGLFVGMLGVQVELDRMASTCRLLVESLDYKLEFGQDIPAGWRVVGMGAPLQIPVFEPCTMTVSIFNAERPKKPFQYRWSLDFGLDAEELSEEAAAQLAEAFRSSIARPN